jgi:hypothetical protein
VSRRAAGFLRPPLRPFAAASGPFTTKEQPHLRGAGMLMVMGKSPPAPSVAKPGARNYSHLCPAWKLLNKSMIPIVLYAPVRLRAGDSIYFDSGMGHACIAAGDGPCRVLSLCMAPEERVGCN